MLKCCTDFQIDKASDVLQRSKTSKTAIQNQVVVDAHLFLANTAESSAMKLVDCHFK